MNLRTSGLLATAILVVVAAPGSAPAEAQFTQQAKLVGTGVIGPASQQGLSVALSRDGNTAIVGAPVDNYPVGPPAAGAAWVFTRSGGVWSQQAKLVGTDAIGPFGAAQGFCVALSGDGNTAIVGGPVDNRYVGAAWVFARSGGMWSEQAKLVGTGALGSFGQEQGFSVSLFGDGNTAIVGGPSDNDEFGATWVFTRSGEVWSQQAKLVGTGAIGSYVEQGISVSLSDDGSTAIVGGVLDNNQAGAAWVFTRSGSVWSQQGAKLVGTGAVGPLGVGQGFSVSLSGNGNIAFVGGPYDNNSVGALWVFARKAGFWSQRVKLVGTGVAGPDNSQQGSSVSRSGEGNIVLVGGPTDNSDAGAAWVFTRSGDTWTQQGPKLVGTGVVGPLRHSKACPSRCPAMEPPRSWVGHSMTTRSEPHGCSPNPCLPGPRKGKLPGPERRDTGPAVRRAQWSCRGLRLR